MVAHKRQNNKIREEIKFIAEKTKNNDILDQDSCKRTCLENEVEFFRSEQDRLYSILKNQIEKIKELEFKQKTLMEDKHFMEYLSMQTQKAKSKIKQRLVKAQKDL